MRIKRGMILAAGLGNRMKPYTIEIPKPLIKVGEKNILERGVDLLISFGVEEIVINVHYLAHKIKRFIQDKNYKIRFIISDEQKELLDTGGGVLNAIESFKNQPFIVLNPDTLWNQNYLSELKLLEELYFKSKKPSLLVVEKKLSFDQSFKGDFNLDSKNSITRQNSNQYIFTGLQILDQSAFSSIEKKIFSMNNVWDNLINLKNLKGLKSKQVFYHLNTKDIYEKIKKINSID